MVVDAAVLRRLYGVAPEEFVASRDAVVKELRAAKDRSTAAEVAKLRRPNLPDWALNSVALEHPGTVHDLLDAAARVRDAQRAAIEGRDGGDIRRALADLRTHSQQIISLADDALAASGRAPGSQLGPLTTRLAEVAANPTAAEQLRGAHLGSEELVADDLFAGLTTPPRPADGGDDRTKRSRPRARKQAAPADAPAPARADPAARRRLERSAAAARRASTSAEAALAKASTRLAAAERAAADAEAALAEAETALAEAQAELAAAEERRQRAAEEADRATAAVDRAGGAVEKAHAGLGAAQDQHRRAVEESDRAVAARDDAEAALAAG
jgi:hypothetical protein